MYIKSLENDGMISFEDDFLPEWRKFSKNHLRALMSEQKLRKEIISLKKQLKDGTAKC
jgi:hypothetical protein